MQGALRGSGVLAVYSPALSLQLHAVVMAMFASIIAPFGGFFASGFKRGFKIKDFGDSIPGHGGMTDRMDCQVSGPDTLKFPIPVLYGMSVLSMSECALGESDRLCVCILYVGKCQG